MYLNASLFGLSARKPLTDVAVRLLVVAAGRLEGQVEEPQEEGCCVRLMRQVACAVLVVECLYSVSCIAGCSGVSKARL